MADIAAMECILQRLLEPDNEVIRQVKMILRNLYNGYFIRHKRVRNYLLFNCELFNIGHRGIDFGIKKSSNICHTLHFN